MKKILSVCAVAALAVLGFAGPAQAAQPLSAAMNNEAYWESSGVDCVKVELPNGIKTFMLDYLDSGEYTQLILKAGSGAGSHSITGLPDAGVGYTHPSGKGISHAIYCVGVEDSYPS